MAGVAVDKVIDALYGLPLEEFTRARDEAARELRQAGDREDAERVKSTKRSWGLSIKVRVVMVSVAVAGGLLFAGCVFGAAGRQAAGVPRVGLGVLGDPVRFERLTGQRSRSRLLIVGWGQGGTPQYFLSLFATMGKEPILGLNTTSGGAETITPGQIARGAGDSYLEAINQAVSQWGKTVYVRPLGEMNGHWNAYSAYNADGSARNPDHSTAWFRKAFARIYLILHGGPGVNARLARLGLPPVHAQLAANPLVRVIWNPQGYGSPDLPGNTAQAYYPGDAYHRHRR